MKTRAGELTAQVGRSSRIHAGGRKKKTVPKRAGFAFVHAFPICNCGKGGMPLPQFAPVRGLDHQEDQQTGHEQEDADNRPGG